MHKGSDMRTAILLGFLTTLIFISCPSFNSDAGTRIYSLAPSSTAPNSSASSSANAGGDTSPVMSFAPIALGGAPTGGATNDATVTIDAASVRHPINKGNFGGKIMKELEAYSLYKNWQNLKALTPGFWIWTQAAGASSYYRWDLHEALKGGYEIGGGSFSVAANGVFTQIEAPSTSGVDYWQGTDIRHCVFVNKVVGTAQAAVGYIFRDSTGAVAGRSDVYYLRFDFKVDAKTPFRSPAGDPWCLVRTDSSSRVNYRVFVTEDMRINVVVYSATPANPATPTKMRTSKPFTRGQWHTLEVYYKPGSKSSAAAYYLDGVRQDIVTGLDTSTSGNADFIKCLFGCISGKDAAGKVYIDAVRMHNAYTGTNPGDPRNFIGALTFDSNPITVDDFLYYAEKAGATPVLQVSIFPPGTNHDYLTPQFSADFVEYVNGVADPDYTAKAKTLDFTHRTPSDNWANLRAARGHVEPYNVKYFTMGNEPYWADKWPKDNPSLYANECHNHIIKMKEVDPTIKAAVFMYNGSWNKAALTTNKDVLDWVCIVHDYSYEMGVALSDQIPRLLGISAARDLATGKSRISGHSDARAALAKYLTNRNDADTLVTAMDEHGFCIVYPPGAGSDLGYAIQRLGYRLETIEQGGPNAWDGDWLLISDQKYTYGIIGSDSLTPSYWAYRLFYDHFGSKYLNVTINSPKHIIPSYKTGVPLYETPYISAYASLDDTGEVMKIIVINRSTDTVIPVNFTLQNFASTAASARVFKVGGAGKKVTDTNLVDPANVTIHESQIPLSGAAFTFNAEPLSMNAIEVCKFAQP